MGPGQLHSWGRTLQRCSNRTSSSSFFVHPFDSRRAISSSRAPRTSGPLLLLQTPPEAPSRPHKTVGSRTPLDGVICSSTSRLTPYIRAASSALASAPTVTTPSCLFSFHSSLNCHCNVTRGIASSARQGRYYPQISPTQLHRLHTLTAFNSPHKQPHQLDTPTDQDLDTMTADTHSIETPPRARSPVHGFGTLAIHAGSPHDPVTGAVIEPLSLSTTFAQTSPGQPVGDHEYARSSNPNRDNFEKAIAALEKARHALAFSSGSATTATILQSLAAGSHVVSISDVYGGTHRYFTKVAAAHGVEVTFSHCIEEDIADLIRPEETRLIWIESPSNPTLSMTDIRAIATTAHKHGIMVVVDNTFLSPYIQNPLEHGADIVVHSVTKYINGHSDVVMGVAAFNSDLLFDRLRFLQNAIGAIPSPFDCWLAHRGLKTLHLRARAASENAAAIAHALEASPHVLAVNYPGLPSHKQFAITQKQHRDGLGGGMLSFRLKGGLAAAERFVKSTQLFTLAESLGGVESLVEVPASMTHMGIPKAERDRAGVYDDLVRVSVGIEERADLVRDVLQALEKAVVAPKLSNGLASSIKNVASTGEILVNE